eukprot:12124859-Alexandrium_andersonii.AAC.1
MSASLVGSEMCIRDSLRALRSQPRPQLRSPPWRLVVVARVPVAAPVATDRGHQAGSAGDGGK